jgi:hypothetical protein
VLDVVSDVVEVGVELDVVVVVVGVEDEVVVVDEVEVVDDGVEVVDVDVVVVWQSWTDSWPTVATPCLRLAASAGFTDEGRLSIALLSAVTALAAAPQLPEPTADDSWSSWFDSDPAWSLESRPEPPPPQATRNAAAKPSPPAKSARGAEPIRVLTLDTVIVCSRLGGAS